MRCDVQERRVPVGDQGAGHDAVPALDATQLQDLWIAPEGLALNVDGLCLSFRLENRCSLLPLGLGLGLLRHDACLLQLFLGAEGFLLEALRASTDYRQFAVTMRQMRRDRSGK